MLLKWLLPIVSVSIIYQRIDGETLQPLLQAIKQAELHWVSIWMLLLVVLSAFNWVLDTFTWQLFLPTKAFPFYKLLQYNIISLSFGFFTPFQIGEYHGKQLLTDKLKRKNSYYSTLAYQTVKLLAKLFLGLSIIGGALITAQEGLGWVVLFAAVVLIVGYSSQDFFWKRLGIHRLLEKYGLHNVQSDTPIQFRLLAILSSLLKVLVYSFQFYLCVYFVAEQTSFLAIFPTIVLFYTVSAWLPSLGFLDPLTKGSLGLIIISTSIIDPGLVLFATTLVWLINVGIPAVAGSLLHWRVS
ncbi:MAG: lysylphosphatidylglycerol synthase domain-containing protein [Schleiferiaceae bacterium]|nr:lysylphosphatidylglycerol synthase domain-containing protein [Schleiferiaceae bacterium]